jgi:WD40 repeat protein
LKLAKTLFRYLIGAYFFAKGHTGDVVGALLDPECRQLVTCGGDRQLRLHDLASGMQVYCKTLSQQPSCVAWRHHRLLVGTVEGILLAWDLRQVRQTSQVQAHQGVI